MTNEKACIASKNMSLDILRIIAALMVLMVHVGQWTGLNKWTEDRKSTRLNSSH